MEEVGPSGKIRSYEFLTFQKIKQIGSFHNFNHDKNRGENIPVNTLMQITD